MKSVNRKKANSCRFYSSFARRSLVEKDGRRSSERILFLLKAKQRGAMAIGAHCGRFVFGSTMPGAAVPTAPPCAV